MLFKYLPTILASTAFLFSSSQAQTPQACNNSPNLCSTPYSNVTYLGAHNSAFIRDESTSFSTSGNHFYNTTVQLSAGVRMLSAQVHRHNDSSTGPGLHLCHSTCTLLDAGRLRTWLGEINNWMTANPNEVVTILLVNADNVDAADLDAEFEASRIKQYAYTPELPTSANEAIQWPTLGDMIASNTRLVSFIASLSSPSPSTPYLLNLYDHTFENEFENLSPSDFSCNPSSRFSSTSPADATGTGRLFIQNHFLYDSLSFGIEIPDVDNVNVTNAVDAAGHSLGRRIRACEEVYGRPASFVMVDFFNVGPAVESVDRANGVERAVGRVEVGKEVVEGRPGQGTGGRVGVEVMVMFGALVIAVAGVLL